MYSTELYWYSFAEGIFSVIFIGKWELSQLSLLLEVERKFSHTTLFAVFFILTVPFWLINKCFKNSILDQEYRTGICYEPVHCCSCIWHVWKSFVSSHPFWKLEQVSAQTQLFVWRCTMITHSILLCSKLCCAFQIILYWYLFFLWIFQYLFMH